MKVCANPKCGAEFEPDKRYLHRKYHSKKCRDAFYNTLKYQKWKNLDKAPRLEKNGRDPTTRRLWNYKNGAKRRGIIWALTDEQAVELFSRPCHYCGGVGGGIDRIDSSLGYFFENCAPCCKHCNVMKLDLPIDQFFAHVNKIVEYQSRIAWIVFGKVSA